MRSATGRSSSGSRRPRASGAGPRRGLAEAVARDYFKLLAYKDEYEVARLYTERRLRRRAQTQFEGDDKLEFHLAPPLLARRDPATGEPARSEYGPWMLTRLPAAGPAQAACAARASTSSATSAERRIERAADRRLRAADRRDAGRPRPRQPRASRSSSRRIPEQIRGFGHVKARHLRAGQGARGRAAGGVPGPGHAAHRGRVKRFHPRRGQAGVISLGPAGSADDDRVADDQDRVVRQAGAGGRERVTRLNTGSVRPRDAEQQIARSWVR